MARLNQAHKRFIVERLACFEEPSRIARAVKEEFGLDLDRRQVWTYDPTKPANAIAEDLKDLFEKTRKSYTEATSGIGISHKSFRLQRLQKLADRAETMGNLKLAAELIEQAAKEVGEVYTNRTRQELTGKDGGPVQQEVKDPYAAERERARVRDERINEYKSRMAE